MDELSTAFKELRQMGLIARQNHWCCENCAGTQIATDASEAIDAGMPKEDIKGCVFYHNQANERKLEGKRFYLSFGELDTQKHGKIGLSTEQVGKLVCQVLIKHYVYHEWNGDPNSTIEIKGFGYKQNVTVTTDYESGLPFSEEEDKTPCTILILN